MVMRPLQLCYNPINSTKARLEKMISSIHQSEAWKEWYGQNGYFNGEPQAVSFGLCLDGTNPFSHDRISYSMCPITLIPLNLPETVRKCCASTVLVGIIPGPNEARNLDAYIDVLVDEVVHLNSLTLFDAYKSETFSLSVNILLNIFDYPGQNKVLKCQGELY